MEFVNWSMLATYAGALSMVLIITQFTKGIKFINTLPTQLWSYIIALVVLYPAYYFTGQLNLDNAILIMFNGVIIAFAANGGFDALKKMFPSLFGNK